ncbi:MAG: hypothetical protein U0R19_26540 [Bryobacteraceae bacterium]
MYAALVKDPVTLTQSTGLDAVNVQAAFDGVTFTTEAPPVADVVAEPEPRVKVHGEVGTNVAVILRGTAMVTVSGFALSLASPDQDWNCAPGTGAGVN